MEDGIGTCDDRLDGSVVADIDPVQLNRGGNLGEVLSVTCR